MSARSVHGPEQVLSVDTIGTYLRNRGLVAPDVPIEAITLGGGVSNVVLAARAGDHGLVVKQSLPRLRVADEWRAARERILTEAQALSLASSLTPGAVPTVYDIDTATFTITIARAPEVWRPW